MAEAESNPKMDQAADDAKRELMARSSEWDALAMSRWWKKWYAKAGHKRLGRALLELTASKQNNAPSIHQRGRRQVLEFEDMPSKASFISTPKSEFSKISSAATLIKRAEQTVIDDVKSGLVKDEEGISERLIGAIHQQFNDRVYSGIRWSAMTLSAHKRKAQESWYGADLLGVLKVELDDYFVQKGFLVQAKYLRVADRFPASEFTRLKQQCEKMLKHSSASYVFLYETAGISVLPAVAVVSLENAKKLTDLKRRSLGKFFEEHFDCFVGDQALHSAGDKTLEDLRDKVEAHRVLRLSGKAQ